MEIFIIEGFSKAVTGKRKVLSKEAKELNERNKYAKLYIIGFLCTIVNHGKY